jgi:hypothetical protein
MATIEDLKIPSITEMPTDEAIEYLRQLRLSRRIPEKKKPTTTKAKNKPTPKLSQAQASELLKLLGG